MQPNLGGLRVGLIADGNRRWAEKHGRSISQGYSAGADKAVDFIRHCAVTEVSHLAIYAASRENIEKRGRENLSEIFTSINSAFRKILGDINSFPVAFNVLGNTEGFGEIITKPLEALNSARTLKPKMSCTIIFNYSIDWDLRVSLESNPKHAAISRSAFIVPPLDLVIRTSGERRLSGFLPIQSSYAELVFVDTLWPDFSLEQVQEISSEYQRRKRRFGE
jgi:undecaprenyl diphosphate synthase